MAQKPATTVKRLLQSTYVHASTIAMGNTMKQLITPKKCTERNCTNKIIKKWARCKSLALGLIKKTKNKERK